MKALEILGRDDGDDHRNFSEASRRVLRRRRLRQSLAAVAESGDSDGDGPDGTDADGRRRRPFEPEFVRVRKHQAATRVQAFARGCLCRQRVSQMVTQMVTDLVEYLAACRIQAVARGEILRRQLEQQRRQQRQRMQSPSTSTEDLVADLQRLRVSSATTNDSAAVVASSRISPDLMRSTAPSQQKKLVPGSSSPSSRGDGQAIEENENENDSSRSIGNSVANENESLSGTNANANNNNTVVANKKRKLLNPPTLQQTLFQPTSRGTALQIRRASFHRRGRRPGTAVKTRLSSGIGGGSSNTAAPTTASFGGTNFPKKSLSQLSLDSTESLSMSTRSSVARRNRNLLTVFQASPIAYHDANEEPRFSMPRLDLHFERDTILDTVRGSNLSVKFEIATDSSFGAFLAKPEGHALHISCHGNPKQLAFENGWGRAIFIPTSSIKQWVASSSKELSFVFVSACNSYAVGKAFEEAGVPHVVCCHKETTILNSAIAYKFTKCLYQALAWGKTLREAFDLATQELSIYSSYESQQYCLLPEDGDHDVHIFSSSPADDDDDDEAAATSDGSINGRPGQEPEHEVVNFPPPPDFFVRDELEVYKTFQAISKNKIVQVTGQKGIGKTTLLKECCSYLNDRLSAIGLDGIIYKSAEEGPSNRKTSPKTDRMFQRFFRTVEAGSSVGFAEDQALKALIEYFKPRRYLLVINAKRFSVVGVGTLLRYIEKVVQAVPHLKVVVIHRYCNREVSVLHQSSPAIINVVKLSIEKTIRLFARYCPHVAAGVYPGVVDAAGLWRFLAPTGPRHQPLSRRHTLLLRLLGGDNPSDICRVAWKMSKATYITLIDIGAYRDLDNFESRAELMLKQFEYRKEISRRHECDDESGAQRVQQLLDCLECFKTEFLQGKVLFERFWGKLDDMLRTSKYGTSSIHGHHQDAMKLRDQMKREEVALIAWLMKTEYAALSATARAGGNVQIPSSEIFQSRLGLDLKHLRLSERREKVAILSGIDEAEFIDLQLQVLEELRYLKPRRSHLKSKLDQFHVATTAAVTRRNNAETAKTLKYWTEVIAKMLRTELRVKGVGGSEGSSSPTHSPSLSARETMAVTPSPKSGHLSPDRPQRRRHEQQVSNPDQKRRAATTTTAPDAAAAAARSPSSPTGNSTSSSRRIRPATEKLDTPTRYREDLLSLFIEKRKKILRSVHRLSETISIASNSLDNNSHSNHSSSRSNRGSRAGHRRHRHHRRDHHHLDQRRSHDDDDNDDDESPSLVSNESRTVSNRKERRSFVNYNTATTNNNHNEYYYRNHNNNIDDNSYNNNYSSSTLSTIYRDSDNVSMVSGLTADTTIGSDSKDTSMTMF